MKQETIKKYSFWRLLNTELKFNLTLGKILGTILGGIALPVLIAYIPSFINGAVAKQGATPEDYIYGVFLGATSMFVFARVVQVVREKSTVDKNKAAFLLYGKNKVTGAKLVVEAILFSIGFFTLAAIALIGPMAHANSFNYGEFLGKVFVVILPYLIMYLFIYSVGKWVIAFIPKKGAAYAVAMLLTLVMLSPIMILNAIEYTTILHQSLNQGGAKPSESPLSKHQLLISFVPVLNFGLVTGVGLKGGLDHDWYVIIASAISMIMIAATWNVQSSAQKRYLAAA